MSGVRRSVLLVLAGVTAVVVAASSGAVAATVITGTQIKNGTITSADLKDGTVASVDIKNGGVKQADVAGGYLTSGRVITRTVSILSPPAEGRVLFTHRPTGLTVAYANPARLRLTNTSTTATIAGSGVGHYSGTVYSRSVQIPPGASEDVLFDAVGTRYVSFVLRQRQASAGSSPAVSLSCMLDDASPGNAFTCTAVG
jgi:hypothetical protein